MDEHGNLIEVDKDGRRRKGRQGVNTRGSVYDVEVTYTSDGRNIASQKARGRIKDSGT